MGHPEIQGEPGHGEQPGEESLQPNHFYAAYSFDRAETRPSDLEKLITQATHMGYPVRYWWLSEAMDLQGSSDRLIVCAHHPSRGEDAGMDLYDALKVEKVTWDSLEAAWVGEYSAYGKPVTRFEHLRLPDQRYLFPDAYFGLFAQEWTQQVARQYGVEMPFTQESIAWLDQWIEENRANFPIQLFGRLSLYMGAFVGEYLRAQHGGHWQYQEEKRMWGVQLSPELFAFPDSKVYKHLKNGPADSILAYVEMIEGIVAGNIEEPGSKQ